jgi:hypothetical protein
MGLDVLYQYQYLLGQVAEYRAMAWRAANSRQRSATAWNAVGAACITAPPPPPRVSDTVRKKIDSLGTRILEKNRLPWDSRVTAPSPLTFG